MTLDRDISYLNLQQYVIPVISIQNQEGPFCHLVLVAQHKISMAYECGSRNSIQKFFDDVTVEGSIIYLVKPTKRSSKRSKQISSPFFRRRRIGDL